MTFGLPQNLAPRMVRSSFTRAAHVAAFVILGATEVMVLATQASAPEKALWPAAIATVPLGVALFILDRRRTAPMAVLFLVTGAACVFVVTVTFVTQLPQSQIFEVTAFQNVKVITLLVGGVGRGRPRALVWCASGYAVAEASAAFAMGVAGVTWRFDTVTAIAFSSVILLSSLSTMNGTRGRRVEARLRRAAHDDVAAAVMYRAEQRAAAILHDTVLNHLTAIAQSEGSALHPELLSQLRQDIERVDGAALGGSLDVPSITSSRSAEWVDHPVHCAVRSARADGLDVEVTGDPGACLTLSAHNGAIAALAVTQCLANVGKHSGVSEAELSIHSVGGDVMFMVIDGGRGFDVSTVAPDRLGIRNSIRGRIEGVGGSVKLWTGVGTGTSVILQVPREDQPQGADAERRVTVTDPEPRDLPSGREH